MATMLNITISGDTLTSFFTMLLLLLVGGLGKVFYDAFRDFRQEFHDLIKSNDSLKEAVTDHEKRITDLEEE